MDPQEAVSAARAAQAAGLDSQTILFRLAVAALVGLAVGVEREWSADQGKGRKNERFAGVRTFLLFGLIGGAAALLALEAAPALGVTLVAGALAVVAAAYFTAASDGVRDSTTEVAAIVVLAAGALAGFGLVVPASAVAALTALALVSKGRLHDAVDRLKSEEIEAAARFAALALVVLPLLPEGPLEKYGGIEPRKLWGLVLLFAGLSFAGYVAMRLVGRERGYGVAGLLGGLVSSTAVTFNFARESRRDAAAAAGLALGVVAASTVLPFRVLALTALLHRETAMALLPAVALPAAAGLVFVGIAIRRGTKKEGKGDAIEPRNPLRLGAAIQMVVLFQVVLWVLDFVRERMGESGIVTGAALVGLTDMDALTFSSIELAKGGLPPAVAARSLVVGMLSNTLFKAVVAAALGAAAFRWRVAAALGLFALGFGAALFWL
jgi:uncharacterized membrane protein (DUF4010 family)